MKISRYCEILRTHNTMEIPVTEEQYHDIARRMARGELIQNIAPYLSDDEREFFITGLLPEQWDKLFPEKEFED